MFKEKYKKDNEMINPSDEFLERLKMKMEEEEKSEGKHKASYSKKILLTAASIALIFISITVYNKNFNTGTNNIIQSAEISDSSEKSENKNNIFSNSKWYDSSLSNEEVYHVFIERISSKEDLKELSVSSEKNFNDSKTMTKEEIEKLVELLDNGRLIGQEGYSKDNPKYYMASFKNGDVIKFTTYNDDYFECNEFKGVFLITKK